MEKSEESASKIPKVRGGGQRPLEKTHISATFFKWKASLSHEERYNMYEEMVTNHDIISGNIQKPKVTFIERYARTVNNIEWWGVS